MSQMSNPVTCHALTPFPLFSAPLFRLRYAIVDIMGVFYEKGNQSDLQESIRWIDDRYPMVFEEQYSDRAISRFVFEQHQRLSEARRRLTELRQRGVSLRVYDLTYRK